MEGINKTKNIKIVHWNCNSIINKFEELKIFLLKYEPHIIMLNETKVNDSTANNLLNQLSNHKYLHKQRNERNGAGGVSIIIKDCIEFDNYYSLDHLNL